MIASRAVAVVGGATCQVDDLGVELVLLHALVVVVQGT